VGGNRIGKRNGLFVKERQDERASLKAKERCEGIQFGDVQKKLGI